MIDDYNDAFDAAVERAEEDEVEELQVFGGEIVILRVGLDRAMSRARTRFFETMDVTVFEAEVERLMRKGWGR